MNTDEIIDRLKLFNKYITVNYPKTYEKPIEITLLGGAAGALEYEFPRSTFDVDSLPIKPDEFNNIAREFGFDIVSAGLLNLPDEYISRRRKFDGGFTNIIVYTLSPEDLFISKLGRGNIKDIEDCKYLLKKGYVKKENMYKIVQEWKPYYVGNEKRLESTFNSIING